jgi:hypothetical protein
MGRKTKNVKESVNYFNQDDIKQNIIIKNLLRYFKRFFLESI